MMPPTKAKEVIDHDAKSAQAIEKEKTVEPGMLLESKCLYRSDPREDWDVWVPDNIGVNPEEGIASAEFALIVKQDKIQEDDGSYALKLHSLQVQSPLIKTLLGPVFENYPGIKISLKKLVFFAPFREFFYRWEEFLQASRDSEHDELQAAHFKLLFEIVSAEMGPEIEEANDLSFNNLSSLTSFGRSSDRGQRFTLWWTASTGCIA
jgi:hypothetical protein